MFARYWLFKLARGYDDEPVTLRPLPKSIGCSKNFRGPEALTTKEKVELAVSVVLSRSEFVGFR